MPKKKASTKKPKAPPFLMNLKVTARERDVLELQADKYANGNLSAWLRHAGRHYCPKKGEFIR
jgi:hypothetical protein